jgi:glycosyltransferase involved in cell wall biosynthesis
MISFIVPAHNEEAWISCCLAAIHESMKVVEEGYELVVADDASTDCTRELAEAGRAQVVRVDNRHISATRNDGAIESHGDILFFVDADTLVNERVILEAVAAMNDGAAGGGCIPKFEGRIPLWWRAIYPMFALGAHWLGQPGGSCMFCTRKAFEAVGGFSEAHFAAEDAVFATALKQHGRFVVPTATVVTSGRNLRAHSFWSIARLLTRLALHGPDGFRDRKGLDVWYKPMREKSR